MQAHLEEHGGTSADSLADNMTKDFVYRTVVYNIMDVLTLSGAHDKASEIYWTYRQGLKGVPIRFANRIVGDFLSRGRYHEAKSIMCDGTNAEVSSIPNISLALVSPCSPMFPHDGTCGLGFATMMALSGSIMIARSDDGTLWILAARPVSCGWQCNGVISRERSSVFMGMNLRHIPVT